MDAVEIDVLKREMDAVIKVLQINLVRFLQDLDNVDEEIESGEKAHWMRDLPIQKTIKDYRQTVSNILTSYHQLENVYKEYFEKFYGLLKSFSVEEIKEELDIMYREKFSQIQKELEIVKNDRDVFKNGMETYKQSSIEAADKLADMEKELEKTKKNLDNLYKSTKK